MSIIDLNRINLPTLWWRKHRRYWFGANPTPPVSGAAWRVGAWRANAWRTGSWRGMP